VGTGVGSVAGAAGVGVVSGWHMWGWWARRSVAVVVRCWGVGVGTGGTGVVFSVVLCLVESWHRLRNWCLVFTKGDTGVV